MTQITMMVWSFTQNQTSWSVRSRGARKHWRRKWQPTPVFLPGKSMDGGAWRKKAFFSDQCKEIEGNNRMGQTRDLFKKMRDTKRHFMQRWAQ